MRNQSQKWYQMVLFGSLRKRVVVINLQGIITQDKAFKVYSGLKKVSSYNTQAVFLSISSLMGSLVQANNILEAIKTFTYRQGKPSIPFYSFAEDYCLSSANLLLAGADKAYCNRFSLLGDLGYVQASVGLQGLFKDNRINIESIGYQANKISSSRKLEEGSENWIQGRLQGLQHDLEQRIGQRRKVLGLEAEKSLIAPARAIQMGLVEAVDQLDEVLEREYKGVKVVTINTNASNLLPYGEV